MAEVFRMPAGGEILLVIPAYRESRRLPAFLEPLLRALREAGLSVGVRVVDDGSPPAEAEALRSLCATLAGTYPELALTTLPENVGKGGAIRAGWRFAGDATRIGFCDADGSVPPEEIVRLVRLATSPDFRADALIASRNISGATVAGRTPLRRLLSFVFGITMRLATGLSVRDSQCGCKFVRRETYDRICHRITETRFAFDVELLARIASEGGRIAEVPVVWRGRSGGALRPFRDGFAMLAALRRIRRAGRVGARNARV